MEWLRNIAPIIFLARNHCRMSVFKDYVVSNKLWNYMKMSEYGVVKLG